MRKKVKRARRKGGKSNPLPDLLKKTQTVVNRWVRNRDREYGCICEGCNGAVEHASHYFSQGGYSALRFDVDNIWGSCAKCNVYLHGNLIMYRMGLVDRMGEDFVTRLEDKCLTIGRTKKWTREELEQIIKKYSLL